MRTLYQISRALVRLEKALIILIFGMLIGSIFLNIITRNFFGISFHFILEFSPALVLWLALLGSSLAIESRRHIKIEVLLRFCGPRCRSGAHVAVCIFGMAVMGVLLYVSLDFVANEIDFFGREGSLSVIFPLFCSISFLRFFIALFRGKERRPITDDMHPQTGNFAP